MKKKTEYTKPVAELVEYESVEVLTASNDNDLFTDDEYNYNSGQ